MERALRGIIWSRGFIDATRIDLLDSWKCGHTGFSAHNSVTVRADDYDGIERLARYLLRPPLSLDRLSLEPGLARYRHKQAPQQSDEPFDPAELLARMLMHVPAPRLHLVRYFGRYAHVCRAQLIRSIYEVDPLLCTGCGARMRILSFITDLKKCHPHIGRLLRESRILACK